MSLELEFTAPVVGDGRARQKSAASPMAVFVADDDEAMREAVATSLRAVGHKVVEARDGAELLDLLRATTDAPLLRPGLVVADVRMPKLSGLGVLAALQRAQWNVPVLLITALTEEFVQTVACRMGAIGVLRKPFETDDLLTAVLNAGALFERSRSSRPPPVSTSGVDGQPRGATRAAPKTP